MSGLGSLGATILKVVEQAKPIAASARTDAYEILRGTNRVADDSGGYTETPAVAEAGYCNLTAGAVRPEERQIADRAGSQSPYVARNMPAESIVTAQDTIRFGGVGGRVFEVIGVAQTEALRVVTTAVLEERT